MLKKRVLAAALCLCLLAGTAVPARAEVDAALSPADIPASGAGAPENPAESPEASASERPADPGGLYALEPPAPGAPLLTTRAGSIADGGTCGRDGGDNLTWTLDEGGTLTIEGSGAMEDYAPGGAPWYSKYNSAVTALVLPDGLTSIGKYAFQECGELASVTIPGGVAKIGWHAFDRCTSLASIAIPGSVASIGDSAFDGCSSLTGVAIPGGVHLIGNNAFRECSSLASVTISDGVASIGGSAFQGCSSLTSVTIPDSVTSIAGNPFSSCRRLTQVTVGSGNPAFTSVDGALFNKAKTSLLCYPAGKQGDSPSIPDGVTSIGGSAFEGCSSLASVLIPDGVTTIDCYAFQGCSSLTSVTIPGSVASIGNSAFEGCSSLASITIPHSVAFIDCDAFRNCVSLTSAAIPDGVKSIEAHTFNGCSRLTAVSIPASVAFIGIHAFAFCDRLTAICYSGGEAEWEALLSDSPVEIPETAVVYFDGQQPPPPALPEVSAQAHGSAVRLTVTGGELDPGARVLAALDRAAALSGTYDAESGEVTFQKPLESGRKLFFLDPDTLVPLAKPARLQ